MSCLRCISRLLPVVAVMLAAALIYGVGIPMVKLAFLMNGYSLGWQS